MKARLPFLGVRAADSLSDDPQTLNSSHSTLWRQWSIMLWCHRPGIMDQFEYIRIHEEVMLPHSEKEMPLKCVFQKDNDHKHTMKWAASLFQTNKINVMERPAQTSDLNPIESLWGDIKHAVSEAKPRNAEELWNAVHWSWAGIPVHRSLKLVDSMQHRCEAETVVIQLNISSAIHRKAKS